MNQSDKYEYFSSLPYKISVIENDGEFQLFIKELSLYYESDDLEKGFKIITKNKNDLLDKLVEAGLIDEIEMPRQLKKKLYWKKELKLFAIKLLIVGLLILMGLSIGLHQAKNLTVQLIDKVEEVMNK